MLCPVSYQEELAAERESNAEEKQSYLGKEKESYFRQQGEGFEQGYMNHPSCPELLKVLFHGQKKQGEEGLS